MKRVRCIRRLPGRLLLRPGTKEHVQEGDVVELDELLADYLIERGDFEIVRDEDGDD